MPPYPTSGIFSSNLGLFFSNEDLLWLCLVLLAHGLVYDLGVLFSSNMDLFFSRTIWKRSPPGREVPEKHARKNGVSAASVASKARAEERGVGCLGGVDCVKK